MSCRRRCRRRRVSTLSFWFNKGMDLTHGPMRVRHHHRRRRRRRV